MLVAKELGKAIIVGVVIPVAAQMLSQAVQQWAAQQNSKSRFVIRLS